MTMFFVSTNSWIHGAAGENQAVEVVSGAHGVDDDDKEGTGAKALHLDVVTEGGEVAVEAAELAAALIIVGLTTRGSQGS
ncbi:hypothetical protein CRG98_009514 [Punica granatum]|uniref:Uncharacterized protein n=1 Tax=Punica granatum TaxID=22663 RepID=A0A2I0KNI3_PUNGR|nr:hypothetical protein CRG98_009514 [Punica granatum]